MHINFFFSGVGHHEAAWRLPEADPSAQLALEHHRSAVTIAESGKLDSVFFADGLFAGYNLRQNLMSALDPVSVLSALAATTDRIGLIATASTTYGDPYNLARRFATIDHLSNGRAGWNIVTSAADDEARNFSLEAAPPHAARYQRAAEFVDVAAKLWDSWEDDALVADKESGLLAETDRIHAVGHRGEHFRVRGPLGTPRPPQGRPVLVQAGSSEAGMDFAATYAEAVFTAQRGIAGAQAFYADLKGRAAQRGREPEQIRVLPGICPYVGATEAEARAIEQEFEQRVQTDYALRQLSFLLGLEIGEAQLDQKLPPLPEVDSINGNKSRFNLVVDLARAEDLTVRQLLGRLAGGRGHRTIVGTPEQVADDLELWFKSAAADGFNYMPPSIPKQLEVFIEQVVPILQQRGLFRTEYEGETLRDHYGLARPQSQYRSSVEAVTLAP
jgi:FMN-dependent oxidoreductase (nitrilotriacetate monooxygenase family)